MTDEPTILAPYDYEPLSDTKGKYCQAPRHGMTNVRAAFTEIFRVPPDGQDRLPNGKSEWRTLACNDCHDQTLRDYLDCLLPVLEDPEIEALKETDPLAYQALLDGKFDMPDADPHDAE